jgi:hypothetical protein
MDADTSRTDDVDQDASTDSDPVEFDLPSAAEALGISPEAVRKRIARGTLPARKVDGVWMVTIEAAESEPDGRTDAHHPPTMAAGPRPVRPRPSITAIDPSDYARALERIAGLEAQLAQAQADRDRWHEQAATFQATYLHDMAAMRELVAREQAIALRATTRTDGRTDEGRADADASTDGQDAGVHDLSSEAPHRMVVPSPAEQEPAPVQRAEERPWWRRLLGI